MKNGGQIWNEWFGRIQPMITQIPVAPVLGNHETYNLKWKERMPLAYLHYFHLPEEYKNQFYPFDYSGVHFVVLGVDDSQLKLSTYLPDGKKFDEEILRK